MKRYKIELKGLSPLLMHSDNLAWAAVLERWQRVPSNKKVSVAGDDRSPAWRWIGACYHDSGALAIPSDNLMTCLREGGVAVPTGKRGGTFKAATQSGILVDQAAWPLMVRGKTVAWSDIEALVNEEDFAKHEARSRELGFDLFAKRAKVGQSKHVRVRPRFDEWAAAGTVSIIDDQITEQVLSDILDHAGAFCGLGDWRPARSLKSPGPFGRFAATVSAL